MIFRVLFIIIPKWHWAALILALMYWLLGTDAAVIPILIINLILVNFLTKLSVVLHEMGHALTARALGGELKRFVLEKVTGY